MGALLLVMFSLKASPPKKKAETALNTRCVGNSCGESAQEKPLYFRPLVIRHCPACLSRLCQTPQRLFTKLPGMLPKFMIAPLENRACTRRGSRLNVFRLCKRNNTRAMLFTSSIKNNKPITQPRKKYPGRILRRLKSDMQHCKAARFFPHPPNFGLPRVLSSPHLRLPKSPRLPRQLEAGA